MYVPEVIKILFFSSTYKYLMDTIIWAHTISKCCFVLSVYCLLKVVCIKNLLHNRNNILTL